LLQVRLDCIARHGHTPDRPTGWELNGCFPTRAMFSAGGANGEQTVATNDPRPTISHLPDSSCTKTNLRRVRDSVPAPLRIQHPVRDRVVHKIGASPKFQFFINSLPIGLDGPFTNAEFHRNRLGGEPLCDPSQDLCFTATEPFRLRFGYRGSPPPEPHSEQGSYVARIFVGTQNCNSGSGDRAHKRCSRAQADKSGLG
jgi:hypothetical protein